jgi:signal transduction histidine kinase
VSLKHFESNIGLRNDVLLPFSEGKFERALENLFDNACRYSSGGDKIRFTVQETANSLNICMEDSGIGVSPKNRENIFELFFREDNSRNTRGMGIGLSMVQNVIESMKGEVHYFDSELGGAGFEIILPIQRLIEK